MPTIHLTPRLHRDVCFFFSAERVSAGKRWLLGAAGNAVAAEGRRISVPLPPKEMCSTSSPTGWCHWHHPACHWHHPACHCHHDTKSAMCRARRSVGPRYTSPLATGHTATRDPAHSHTYILHAHTRGQRAHTVESQNHKDHTSSSHQSSKESSSSPYWRERGRFETSARSGARRG